MRRTRGLSLLRNVAQGFYLAGEYEQAAASYARALKLDPSLTDAWLNMGNALYFLGRYQESLDAYDALLKREPGNANALQARGLAFLSLNRTYL